MNQPIRIVLIEDSEDDYLLTQEALLEGLVGTEFTLQWFDHAPDPDEFLEQYDPDVILIDYSLGAVNGVEFARAVRQRNVFVSLVLLTGLSAKVFEEVDQQVKGVGISDLIPKKEINGVTLSRSVRYAYENSVQRRQLHQQSSTIEDILLRTEMVMWRESKLNEPEERECYCSESVQALTGYTKDEFTSGRMSFMDLVAGNDRERIRQAYEQAVEGDLKLRYRIVRQDRSEIWVEETRETTRDTKTGEITKVVGCFRDITREIELESEQQLMAMSLDQSSDAILITDACLDYPGPRILYVNNAICRMSGYSESELLGQTPRLFQGPKTNRKVLDRLRSKLSGGDNFQGMTTNYRKDGSEYVVSWRISPVVNSSGTVTHYVSTQTDVTKEMRQREQLKEQENFLREIGSLAKVGGWRYLKSTDHLHWTEQIYEIHAMPVGTSVSLEEAMGLYFMQDQLVLREAWELCLKEGVPYDLTLKVRDRRGALKYCHTQGAPIWFNGEIEGAWGVYQDVTESRQRSMDLEQALKDANYANEAKNQFLMMMSHELRTPLKPIIGFAELMLSEVTDPEQCAFLKQIQFSATHLVELIGEILDIASIESGRMHLDIKSFSLSVMVHEVIDMFRPNAKEKNLELKYVENADAAKGEPLICMGDESKLRQILINLLNNAIKFTSKGEVCLELLLLNVNEHELEFELAVRDTGIGISPENCERIFDRFCQVDQTAARRYEGQGIGLNLCRELVNLMGGAISVSSELGSGSVFTVQLSLARFVAKELADGAESQCTATSSGSRRVLVVEDDAMNRLVISQLLQSLSIKHELASDGFEALDCIERENFRLILMDIQMPKLNGIETTRRIRSGSSGNVHAPVVALSAHVVEDIKQEAIEAGMNDFLEKPITLSKLRTFFEKKVF